MTSGGTEVNQFALIHLLEAKFDDDPKIEKILMKIIFWQYSKLKTRKRKSVFANSTYVNC